MNTITTTTPRVAVIMIGNMRSFNVTAKNLEYFLLSPYQCDLYIVTYNKRFNFKCDNGTREEFMNEEMIKAVYGTHLKHLVIINQDTFVEQYTSIVGKKYAFGNALDRFYTIFKLGCLAFDIFRGECIRNKRSYDFIVKIRPDIMLKEKFPLNTSIDMNQLIVPNHNSGGDFNDQIAYGKFKVMDKYLSYYKLFGDIDRLDRGETCDVSIVELGLCRYLRHLGVDIIRIPIHYIIVRDTKPQKVIYYGRNQFYVKTI